MRLKQVLLNLASNAIKFTQQGSVTLRLVAGPGDQLRFEVVDTGCGIPEDRIHLVFEKFRQVDESTARKYGGTGLGLAICKELVELFGGKIWAESEVGRGSRFIFEIELSQGERPREDQERVEAYSGRGESLSVLVADDNRVNRMVARRILEGLGHRVELVEDGEAAVAAVTARRFDVVLMDVQMPRMDGLAATREIRNRGFAELPIVALTANVMSGESERCLAAGMNAFLTKPIRTPSLNEVLDQTFPQARGARASVTNDQVGAQFDRMRRCGLT